MAKIKKYHYTYEVTNVANNKYYIGVRSSDIPPIYDLGIEYFSCSKDKIFKKDQKENPQNYEYKIIGIFFDRETASLNEIEIHSLYNVAKNPQFYNKANASSTGFNRNGVSDSAETRLRKSKAFKGRKYSKEIIERRSGVNHPLFGMKKEDNPNYGSKRTEKQKENISKNHTDVSGEKNPAWGTGKIIQRFDINMNFIDEGDSNYFIAMGFLFTCISKCYLGKQSHHRNFLFKLKK